MPFKLAIQKKGRLQEESLKLLKECGFDFEMPNSNQLKISLKNFDLEIYLLRNSDIPQYIYDNVMDAGMLGENTVTESAIDLNNIVKLDFGKCKMSLAISKDLKYNDLKYFQNKTIATSYPNTIKKFLTENNLNAKIHKINGSVELSTLLGLADSICDIVSTGETLRSNGLKEVHTLFYSQVALFSNKNLNAEKLILLSQLTHRINSVIEAKNNNYILMNVPNDKLNDILKILPGMRSPTVLPLASSGWSSVHTVIKKNNFWNIISLLKENGAEGILVLPLTNMIL